MTLPTMRPFSSNIILVDTEFSTLDPYKGEILSIGIVKMNGDTHLLPFDGNFDWGNFKTDSEECRDIEYISLEVDFNRDAKESKIYKDLSAEEYLIRAYERALRIKDSIESE